MRWLWALLIVPLHAHDIALTFDDVPWGNTSLFTMEKRIATIVEKLDAAHVKGAFFCVGEQIDRKGGAQALSLIEKSGHFLANHSFHHHHLSALTLEEFASEIEHTEALLKQYSTYRYWFRFPYLDYGSRVHLGGSFEKQSAAFALLKQKGYTHAYSTINTFDWYLNGALTQALHEQRPIDFQKLKALYLFFLEKWIDACGRGNHCVKHVLLLHGNDLTALYLDDLIDLLHKKQWRIVSPESIYGEQEHDATVFYTPQSFSCHYIDQVMQSATVFR